MHPLSGIDMRQHHKLKNIQNMVVKMAYCKKDFRDVDLFDDIVKSLLRQFSLVTIVYITCLQPKQNIHTVLFSDLEATILHFPIQMGIYKKIFR